MPFKRKLTILALIIIPPTMALALATAIGWLHFELSLGGVLLVLGAYGGWIAVLAGLTDFMGFFREEEPPGPQHSVPYQAPRPRAEFVGRQDEIQCLMRALKPGAKAAITGVVGMGGLGKTELAKVAAYRVANRFRDGVLWADCGQQDSTTIADLWAAAYGTQLTGNDLPAKAAHWRGLVSGKEVLLIFDNVQPGQEIELLLPPPGQSAVLITTRYASHPVLRGADRLALDQFTSTEAMALAERVLGPEKAHEQTTEGTRLFDLVGYLPLAVSVALHLAEDCDWTLNYLNRQLEAAGAMKVLDSVEDLEKSLQAAFQTAWENLPLDLQETFRALTLFNSGPSFGTQALAETLALDAPEARARLHRLAGRSLLNSVGPERWALHPLLREFAATRPPVDEMTRARMARHYECVARAANDLYLQGGEHVLRGLALFDLEWPHISTGQAWAAAHVAVSREAAQLCCDYADAAVHCLSLRVHPQERITWLEAAIRTGRQLGNRKAVGNHLGNLGIAYRDLGKVRRAIEFYEQALVIAREIGDERNKGYWLGNLGNAYRYLGKTEQAIEYYEQALAIAREIGDERNKGYWMGNLGIAYRYLGKMEQAIECYEQALVVAREIGDRRREANWLGGLGIAHRQLGNVQRAIECCEQALAIDREIGDRRGEGASLGNLGNAYRALGDARRAIEFHEQALAIAQEIGDRHGEGQGLDNLGKAYAALGDIWGAIKYHEQALVVHREIGYRRAEGQDLGSLGNAYATLGEVERAIEYYGQALTIAREISDRRSEASHCWNLGLLYENSNPARAIELMEICVAYRREIGHRDAEVDAQRVAEIRARL